MHRILLSSLALLSLAQPSSAQALKVGDQLPAVQLDGLTQTEAKSFGDFYGRAVLLEFFAHWCAPCAASVPHLNELQERYGARGFSIIGVTSEPAKKTEPWIAKHGAKYAYGYDTKGELQRAFQVTGIPFGALIDPFGAIVWAGHPAQLDEHKVEAALAGALERPLWQWPEDMQPLAQALQAGDFGGALAQATSLPAREGFDLPALVRGRYLPLIERFDAQVARQEYGAASELGGRLEKGLGTLPEAGPLAARLKALRDDPEIARAVADEARMLDLERRATTLKKPADAEALRPDVAKFVEEQAGRKFETRAKALLQMIDRGLARSKKSQ